MHPLSAITSTTLVMTFHGVPTAAWFRGALETIGRWHGFVTAADVRDYLAGGRTLKSSCLVTFDDGELSFLTEALPVLEAMGVPALLFVSPGVLGGSRNYWFQDLRTLRAAAGDDAIRTAIAGQLGVPGPQIAGCGLLSLMKSLKLTQIRRVIDETAEQHAVPLERRWNVTPDEVCALDRHPLVTIGAHSLNHPILANEDDTTSREEIAGSVRALQELLGRPVDLFAYPNGAAGLDFGGREQRVLRECGVSMAFATDTGFVGRRSDPLAIPRAALTGDESVREIQARLLAVPLWDRLRAGRERKERLALRARRTCK